MWRSSATGGCWSSEFCPLGAYLCSTCSAAITRGGRSQLHPPPALRHLGFNRRRDAGLDRRGGAAVQLQSQARSGARSISACLHGGAARANPPSIRPACSMSGAPPGCAVLALTVAGLNQLARRCFVEPLFQRLDLIPRPSASGPSVASPDPCGHLGDLAAAAQPSPGASSPGAALIRRRKPPRAGVGDSPAPRARLVPRPLWGGPMNQRGHGNLMNPGEGAGGA